MECNRLISLPRPLSSGRSRWNQAFTLIEMLVVIGIIGILASIIVAFILPKAQQSALNTVTAELHQMETAIDAYHADFGVYPPDNPNQKLPGGRGTTKFQTWNITRTDYLAPLYYELEGAAANLNSSGTPQSYGTNDAVIGVSDYTAYFGLGGPQNSNPASLKNYLTNLRPAQAKKLQNTRVYVLTTSIGTPPSDADPNINPWMYVSSNPTNNPATYDLFNTNILVGNKYYTLGNWSK